MVHPTDRAAVGLSRAPYIIREIGDRPQAKITPARGRIAQPRTWSQALFVECGDMV